MKGLFLLTILFTATLASSQSFWSIEPIHLGSAKSFSTNLEIEQSSFPKFEFNADYKTRPFEDAPYYGYRISRQNNKHAWEVEFLHHKIYLTNNPPEIQHFEVSHGYNMLFLNHAWIFGSNYVRAGLGPVISHTESEIRGMGFVSSYEFSGIVGQGAFGRRFYLSRIFYFTLEGKFTLATASVSIAQGKAHAPNIAIHGIAGIGFDLGKKD
jgi:hypothetical protein